MEKLVESTNGLQIYCSIAVDGTADQGVLPDDVASAQAWLASHHDPATWG